MEKIKKIVQGDKVIWTMVVLLVLISMLAVYSASESYANNRFHGSNAFVLLKHSALLLFGFLAMVGASCVQYRRYAKILPVLFWVSLPLLLLTIVMGRNINSASRVIGIGFISFQTSDLAKITLVGYLAMVLTKERDKMASLKYLIMRVIIPILAAVGLIFPENFSTAALLFAVCLVMMFIGRVKMKYLLGFVGTIVLVGGLAVFIMYEIGEANPESTNRASTWVHRIQRFMADDEDVDSDANFQVMQSKVAIAGGGVFGKSPGKSTQRNVLPHPYSDFIYAIILEEYGLAGGISVLLIYMIILYRATRIVIRAPQFGALLSFGLAFSLVMQAMVNMGVAVGLLPVTGQPLPFVSMGGTSLLFTGASIGIIISVTKDLDKNEERTAELEAAEADS
ncbi:MAG: FtsW/RodA/SpoVE family cell cycle protein [Bacteroidales bacterium]|nr:FtsW/RodA/SpoVE family cell cycle protein [Bacteroidales bacterium]